MTDDALLGQRLDEYRIETLLGRGGMARIYRALDVRLTAPLTTTTVPAVTSADSLSATSESPKLPLRPSSYAVNPAATAVYIGLN